MRHEEDDICRGLARWFALYYPEHWALFMHIPNGGKRTKIQGAIFKAMGVKPGVPDYFLAIPAGDYAGLWLEVKTAKGKLSPAQKEIMDRLDDVGYRVDVCYGFDECMIAINSYLDLIPPKLNGRRKPNH